MDAETLDAEAENSLNEKNCMIGDMKSGEFKQPRDLHRCGKLQSRETENSKTVKNFKNMWNISAHGL